MALAASLYSGITGLTAHGEKMTVIGNNLANVSTTGFKGAKMYFEDLMSQDISTSAGISQEGRGVRIAAIYSDFGQGSFETTTEATDMAISGEGFFVVSPIGEEANYYTRAGVFRFNNDGYLTDPNGNVVQGWEIEHTGASTAVSGSGTIQSTARIIGTPTDIRLENFQSPPQATSNVTIITNLDPSQTSRSNNAANPYFALHTLWDGQDSDNDGHAISENSYSYSSSIKVYDEIGTSHTLTVYYDQVTLSNAGGMSTWEYIVTCEPSEDGRILSNAGVPVRVAQTSAAGLLMAGTLTFRSGQLIGQSAFTLQSSAGGQLKSANAWQLADFSTDGYPLCTANWLGASDASTAASTNALPMEINFGMRNSDSNITSSAGSGWAVAGAGAVPLNIGAVGNDITNVTSTLPNFSNPAISALASESYDTGGSSTLFQSQDGYTVGILQNVSVSEEGVFSGTYSNGETLELYSLTLATFTNKWGLRRNGGNLFQETSDSGPALTGQAKSSGKGTVSGNTLELSNVDMASEFVTMITTQRGFQANTKVITTTDSMLGEVISMKR